MPRNQITKKRMQHFRKCWPMSGHLGFRCIAGGMDEVGRGPLVGDGHGLCDLACGNGFPMGGRQQKN